MTPVSQKLRLQSPINTQFLLCQLYEMYLSLSFKAHSSVCKVQPIRGRLSKALKREELKHLHTVISDSFMVYIKAHFYL